MSRISTPTSLTATVEAAHQRSLASEQSRLLSPQEEKTREAFQDFVAGTFFKQMFKELRKTHSKPAYLHGGQAEELFQSQLDQQVAEDVARTHGAPLSDALFEAFLQRRRSG